MGNFYLVSDWMRDKAGRWLFGSEFSFGIAVFGITVIGVYFFGKLKEAGIMLLGLGFEVSWGQGKYDGREA